MSAQVTILQLPAAGAITGAEAVPIVQNGVTVQTTTGAIAAAPSQVYTYLTVSQTPQLPNSRYVGVTNGLVLTDGGAQGLFNISTTGALLSLVNSSTGFQVKTDSVTLTNRSIAVANAGLSITNGSGVSGNPTISLDGQVLNFANLSANGLVTITTAGGVSSTLIQGTASQITVANGNAVGGYPTIGIASNPTLPGTAGVLLPYGTTGDRSVSPTNGTLRYNTDFAILEAYLNNTWSTLASGSGVTSILTGTGLTGGPITSTGTISIADTAVTTGTYGNSTNVAQFTVNQQGQLTFAGNVAISASSIGAVTTINGTANEITATGSSTVTLSLPSALTFTGKTVTGGTFSMTAATVGSDTVTTNTATQTLTGKSMSGSSNTFSNIPNSALTNSSVTLGTTNVALGATTLTLGGLTSVAVTQDPTSNLQLATKQYVDSIAATGIHYHEAVYVESPDTAGNLNSTYASGGTSTTITEITGNTYVTFASGVPAIGTQVTTATSNGLTSGTQYWVTAIVGSTIQLSLTYGGAAITSLTNGTGLSIASTLNAGVGATLTNAGTQVALTIDGVLMTVGKRVLIYNQTNATQNGVYTVTVVGTASTNWVLTRATDANTYSPYSASALGQGDAFFVQAGTTGAGETYVVTTTGSIFFGQTNIVFAQISAAQVYSAGTGLTLTGTTFSLTTPVTAILGGTGQTSYANGDLLYASSSTALSKLTLGTSGYVLTAGASAPAYVAQSTLSVGSATNATNATNTAITANSTNATNYLTFVSATSGNLGQLVNSSITCNPSTGVLTGGISGGTF
jgi:hypothetical protein